MPVFYGAAELQLRKIMAGRRARPADFREEVGVSDKNASVFLLQATRSPSRVREVFVFHDRREFVVTVT